MRLEIFGFRWRGFGPNKKPGRIINRAGASRFIGKRGAPGAATNLLTSDDTPARSGGLGAPHLLNFLLRFSRLSRCDPKGAQQESAKEGLNIHYF